MRTLRLKGKHIALAAALLVCVLALILASLPQKLSRMAEDAERAGKTGEALRYYDFIVRYFAASPEAARALYLSAHLLGREPRDGDVFIEIFPGLTSTGGEYASVAGTRLAIDKYRLLLSRTPRSPWAIHALRELGKAYYALGDLDNARNYLSESVRQTGYAETESTILLARIHLSSGEAQEALSLASQSLHMRPNHNPIEMHEISGLALVNLGRFEEARSAFARMAESAQEVFSRVSEHGRQEPARVNIEHYQNTAKAHLERIARLEQSGGITGSVAGRVLVGQAPIHGVCVYLASRDLGKDRFTGSHRDLPASLTDEDGWFRFESVVPGIYALGVRVHSVAISGHALPEWQDDIVVRPSETVRKDLRFVPSIVIRSPLGGSVQAREIRFSWDSVPGAASYSLVLGRVAEDSTGRSSTGYSVVLRQHITTNELLVNVDDEVKRGQHNQAILYSGGRVSPWSILGPLYTGGMFTWGVEAIDSHGRRIEDSLGYRFFANKSDLPLFWLERKALAAADELLLAGRYDEAIREYEAILAEEPGDTHALLVLARLYRFGVSHDSRNPEKSIGYYLMLHSLADSPEVREALVELLFETARYAESERMYRSLTGTEHETWRTHYQLGRIMLLGGQPQSALDALQAAVDMPYGEHAGPLPVALALILARQRTAEQMASRIERVLPYKALIRQYVERGYTLSPPVAKSLASGEYDRAMGEMGESAHDEFARQLLLLVLGRSRLCPENIPDLGDPLLADLLRAIVSN